ncbi:hypothetical protein V6N11_046264 [Hibiscus sabdariffa]|uniref:Pentatricopeptide repeat-containing protein n=1 Tax=Hibiscus sabdariffa TaxID=183260 RepID=A0ABR2A9J0_9ROSI
MQAAGVSADVFSFNALIQSFCRMKKIEKAKKLLVTMLMMGLDPDNYTYGAFVKAFYESGRFDEVIGMFLSMEAKGCFPDPYTCNFVLESLVRKGYLADARDIVKRCNRRGSETDNRWYSNHLSAVVELLSANATEHQTVYPFL